MEVGDTFMPYMEVSFHLACNENFVGNGKWKTRSRSSGVGVPESESRSRSPGAQRIYIQRVILAKKA